MNSSFDFPNDGNGAVLKRMRDNGDDLVKPRNIDFRFLFPERREALSFAGIVDARDLKVCISYYQEQKMWEVMVTRYMIPTHREISAFESDLIAKAESVGGVADGWGCFQVV